MKNKTIVILLIVVGVIFACGIGGFFIIKTQVLPRVAPQLLTMFNTGKKVIEENSNDKDADTNTTDTTPTPDSGKLASACTYLTAQEASDILGVEAKTTDYVSDASCTYTTATEDIKEFAILTFAIYRSETPNVQFDAAKVGVYKEKWEEVTIPGATGAIWVESMNQLSTYNGKAWFIFSALPVSNEKTANKEATVKLATSVMGKVN